MSTAHLPAVALEAPVLLAPLSIEAAAVRRGAPGSRIERTGMGPARALATAGRLAGELRDDVPIVLLGLAGGLEVSARPGDVVVATSLAEAAEGASPVGLDPALSSRLFQCLRERFGGAVKEGRILSSRRVVAGKELDRLAERGEALAVEMESFYLTPLATRHRLGVVRVILDGPGRSLLGLRTVPGGFVALRRLREVAAVVSGSFRSTS